MLGWGVALGAGLPQGGVVANGHASITSPSAGQMVVDQSTQAAVINWQSFDIDAGDSVRFVQPDASSVTLNRVVGVNPSTILGQLTANGEIFLVNPNGVLFAPGASVNVGGIVASTLGITDASFLSGNYHFSGGGRGAVVNRGSITAAHGGYVALIGPSVSNQGTIAAANGAATLGAGATVDMTLSGNTLETFKVSAAALDAQVSNGGAIRVGGGQVILSAQALNSLLQTVVNNSGQISADSAVADGGTVTLLGSGGAVQAGGRISASSLNGAGGGVAISGNSVTVDPGAKIVASGARAGGSIVVGGDLHGGSLPLAATTTVDSGAVLDASATVKGNGGSVQVVSDTGNAASSTVVSGTLIAAGGTQGGDGGRIETSGSTLDTTGISVQASAAKGHAGQWLLDPTMIEIGTTNSGTTTGSSGGTTTYTGTGTSYVAASTIDTALNAGTNVTVQTSGLANSGAFDIWVVSPIQKTAGGNATLTLQAANSVYVGAPISSTSGALNVNLYAGDNGGTLTGTGAVLLASDITTNGGNINFGTNRNFAFSNGVTQLAGGDVYVDSQLTTGAGGGSTTNQLVTLDTTSATGSGGSVNIYGQTVIANPSGFTINTQHTGSTGGDGNVYFAGTVDSGNTFALVSGSYSWNQAYDDAESGTGANVGDTYLATPSISVLNAVASFTANYDAAWLGGERLVANTPTGTPSSSNTTSLDNLWYWVAGPLGLVVNPNSPTGYGTAFFTQYGSTTRNGQSGTAIDGAYTNWNPGTGLGSGNLGTAGEPNNDGGANLTPSGAGEWTMQFVGTAGQWNDLNPTSNSLPFVRETNLAAAPLTVNSGHGSITLGAGVGTNAPLESFNATGNVIDLPQNPAIDTTGGTTINGQVQVYNGSGYTPTTLLTVAASSTTSTYGATQPSALAVTYTVQGQASSSTPPEEVGTASEAWSTTPTSTSNVGIYDSTVSGASCNSCGYTILYVDGALTIDPATVTVSGVTATSRTYNGSTAVSLSGTATLSGLKNGSTGTVTGPLTGTVASPNVQLDAGVAQSQSVTTDFGFTLTSGDASDYTFAQPSLTATISPAPVTVAGLSPVSYTYNGSAAVALSGTPAFTGLVGSQTVTVGNLSTGGLAGSANAGVQTVTGQVQLANGANGGLASNYTVSAQPALSDVTISPAPVTVTGLSPVNYAYDSSTTVALTGTPVFAGLVGNQTLNIGNLITGGVAGDADAGVQSVAAQVQLADGTNGGLASNYALTVQPALSSVTISPAPVTVTGLSPADYTYDGSTTVALTGTPVFAGLVGNQTLTISNVSTGGVAASANAGAQAVTGQLQLANGTNGGVASNYQLSVQPTLSDVTIAPALVSLSGLSPVDYTYDGSTRVALSGTPVFTGLVGNQTLTIDNLGAAGVAGSAHAGMQTVAGQVQLADGTNGGLASNYALSAQPALSDVTINPAAVTVVGSTVLPLTYDGSTQVTIVGAHLEGVLPADEVTLVSNATVGAQATGATVPVAFDDSLTGPDAGDYVIAQQPQGVTASVLPARQTVVAPIQDGVAASATNSANANTSSSTLSTLAVPPPMLANASQSVTSIAVINGGVNAPGSELQINGFWQTLPTTNTKDGRVAVVAR
jgi:filamentous hemagglutinin family protein